MSIDAAIPNRILALSNALPTIKEQQFVSKWLLTLRDYLMGDDVMIGIWLQEMDITAFGEVNVVNTAGELLFTVPSMLMRNDKILPETVAGGIADTLYRADTLNRVIPGRGNAFIRNELTAHVKPVGNEEDYKNRWDTIFVKYGLEPVFSDGKHLNIDGYSSSDDGDFDDYEEL